MAKNKNDFRVSYLDGLRGWAALVVCLYHTALAFSNSSVPNPPKFLVMVQNGYLKPLLDGGLSVKIFFVLSGLALSISFIKNSDFRKLAALLIKRIPRLSIPIFAMSLITHFLMKSNLMFNLKAIDILGNNEWLYWYNFNSSIFKVLGTSFLTPFFGGGSPYSDALWTMPHEMVGSIFVAIVLFLAAFINKNKRIIPIIVLFMSLIVLSYKNAHFAGTLTCFLFGILLAYYLVWKNKDNKLPPSPSLYSIFHKIMLALIILWFYYSDFSFDIKSNLIAVLIIFLVINSSYLQKMLSSKISIFLGKISFPLYLIHIPLIFSLTSFLIVKKYDPNNTLLIAAYLGITAAASIIAAWFLYPVEKFAVTFSHKVFEYFCGDEKIEFSKVKSLAEKIKNIVVLKILK